MRDHIKILAILNIVWSSVSIAIGMVILLLFGGFAGFLASVGMTAADSSNSGGLLIAPFMAIIGLAIVLLICVISLPALIGGIGLLKLRSWSRILMIVVSVLHLFSVPIGTAIGIYGLWVLFQPEAGQILDPESTAAIVMPPPAPPQSL